MNMQADNAAWLFDLGNSRLKGAWLHEREFAQSFALAWDAPDFDAVLQVQLARWPAPARVRRMRRCSGCVHRGRVAASPAITVFPNGWVLTASSQWPLRAGFPIARR